MSHHSVGLHVAGLADRFFILHDIRLSGKYAVTVETAEVLQMPVLALSQSVLVTEDQLRTDMHQNRRLNSATNFKTAEKVMHAQFKSRLQTKQ